MKRGIITIADNGTVSVSGEVRMSIAEIADLFGVFYQTAKSNIRAIQKSGVADGDYSMCCIVAGSKVYPEYYGLDMIIAVAFRVKSERAEVFRSWMLKLLTAKTKRPIYVHCDFAAKELIFN